MRQFILTAAALFLACAGLGLAGDEAQAQSGRKIEDFYGHFAGQGLTSSGPGEDYTQDDRASDVVIKQEAMGFSINWTTLQVKPVQTALDPNESSIKAAVQTFVPSPKPGVWYEQANGNITDGKNFAWARIDGDSLVVTNVLLADDGSYDVTSYERTLVDANHMKLRFTRFHNGDITRRVKAELERQTD